MRRVPLHRLEEAAKKALPPPNPNNTVPIYNHTKTHIWLWLGTPQTPTLVKFTHAKVKKDALGAIWPAGGGMPFAGKIDPAAYSGPNDIQPIEADSDGLPAVASASAIPGPPQDAPLAAAGTTPSKAVPKLLYPIPPNFVRDNSQGWVKFGGAADGLPGKWFDVAAKSGVNAFYTPEGNVLTATTPYAMLWSAASQGVPKLTGAPSAAAWDAGVPPVLVAKLPQGFRASYLKANNYGDILGMMNGAPALAHPADSTYVLLSDFNTPISYGGDNATPKEVVKDVINSEFAFGWPVPPNWQFIKSANPVDVDADGVKFVRGWWWSEKGAYSLSARFRADGVIVYGTEQKRFELAPQGIVKSSKPYASQMNWDAPAWFKVSGKVPDEKDFVLGMIGGAPWLWDISDNQFKDVAKDGPWKSLETMQAMHGAPAPAPAPVPAPVAAPSAVKVVPAASTEVALTNTKFAFGWPIPPNFVPNSPVVIKDAGKKSARIEGTWYGPHDDFPAGMYADGKIMDLEDEETFFDLKKEGVKQGASYESQVTLPNKPAWFAVTKTNANSNRRALGMVGSIPFEWNYKPSATSTPWKNILANDFHTTEDMEMAFGTVTKSPSVAPIAASSDITDQFAFGWPIPPNFVPKKPFKVDLPGTNHAALQGVWHGLKQAVSAEFNADGDVLGTSEADMLHSLALDDIEKGIPYEQQMKIPNKPAWFHASHFGGTKALGMVAGQAWQYDTKPGVAKPFKNGAGESLTLADMEAKYGGSIAKSSTASAAAAPVAAVPVVVSKVDKEFAFSWPIPPNFVPSQPYQILAVDTPDAFLLGKWLTHQGTYDAAMYATGSIKNWVGDKEYLSLPHSGIKKDIPWAKQVVVKGKPDWFDVTIETTDGILGMAGGKAYLWDREEGDKFPIPKFIATTGAILQKDMEMMLGKKAAPVAAPSKLEPAAAPLLDMPGADDKYAFGWPYPPNFKPDMPVTVTNAGTVMSYVPGTWYSTSGPYTAGLYSNGKVIDPADGDVFFTMPDSGIKKGVPYTSQGVPTLPVGTPGWFAATMQVGNTLLGMVGSTPFQWFFKPGYKEPWKNCLTQQTFTDPDMDVEYGSGAVAGGNPSKVYVDDQFAFGWPIPPNFAPYKPFKVDNAGTVHATLAGMWHGEAGLVAKAEMNFAGEIRDAVEDTLLFSLPKDAGIKKDKPWDAQFTLPDQPEWFRASQKLSSMRTLGMIGTKPQYKAFIWKRSPGDSLESSKFENQDGDVFSYAAMMELHGKYTATAPVVPVAKPAKPKATKTAVPKAEMPMTPIMDASKIPDLSGMKKVAGGSALSGAGEKDIYQDAAGNKFLFKVANAKTGKKVNEPFRALTQEIFSSVAQAVRPEHIPIATRKVGNVVGTLQPMLDLASNSLAGVSPKDLSDVEKLDLATDHVLDWVTSQHDTHAGNIVRTKDGRLLTIDKEQGFRFFGSDSLSADYHPNPQEQEPYYNKFWRDFADNKFDFDPTDLAGAFVKLRAMDSAKYADQLKAYAESVPQLANDAYGRDAFVKKALGRRNTAKRDFEKFLTGLYKKRTGVDGKFTFASGWHTGQPGMKKTKVTYDFAEWAKLPLQKKSGGEPYTVYVDNGKISFVVRLYPFDDTASSPPAGVTAAEMLTIKFSGSETAYAKQFCAEFGIEIVGDPVVGPTYTMFFVNRAQLASLDKQSNYVVIHSDADGVPAHGGVAEYLPDLVSFPAADPNVEELDQAHTSKKLGFAGKRIFLDSDLVENQTATVRRMKYEGKTYLQVLLKVRGKLTFKGETSAYPGYAGSHVAEDDVIDTTGGQKLLSEFSSSASACKKVTHGADFMFGYPASAPYALRNLLVAFVSGKDVRKGLRPLLAAMLDPEAADKVLMQPTEEDRRLVKMWRVLNALDPAKHDELRSKSASEKTLLAALESAGGAGVLDQVREADIVDGHMGHVLPGRWKRNKLPGGQPRLRFVFHATKSTAAVPSVLKAGLAGASMRVYSGAFGMGSADQGKVDAEDFATGGADTTQCRVATANNGSHSLVTGSVSASCQFIIAPDVADRVDAMMLMGDSWGCVNPEHGSYGHRYRSRRSVDAGVEEIDGSYNGSVEMVFNRGIHASKILRVTCTSSALRAQVLKACYAAGVTEHIGIPIEDFIVVETQQGPTYEKYVKPAGY